MVIIVVVIIIKYYGAGPLRPVPLDLKDALHIFFSFFVLVSPDYGVHSDDTGSLKM